MSRLVISDISFCLNATEADSNSINGSGTTKFTGTKVQSNIGNYYSAYDSEYLRVEKPGISFVAKGSAKTSAIGQPVDAKVDIDFKVKK